ncbi:MAG: sulfatase/phosphatase domain-containing protein, partial [Verrucomicrobiota bacterium]|nr:sulfatase/phosphatase domain-containing protein [Verrucomicrobiota bacterium]
PTIAWWPGRIAPGTEDDAHWYFGDVMATVAELAGVEPPTGIDSDSFAGPLRGQPRKKRWDRKSRMYWEFYERGSAQAVRFGKWKAIRKPMFTGTIELYDMSNDPGEKHDFSERRPDLARHAAQLLDRAHEPDPNWKVR